ncbi:Fur family transcriptional regulator [Marinomonas mediterranea]|jgi:Fe2+/Zn2+ uptake regulation proteins|uniref:Ferric uptake regulator, Fur family n=1 Tax=Marinomonas mediterranea (strain ATCC 700492 / JCM 21426 / NBRC 103028 / MMB-1) TaxID=717774 RepID=F2JWA9_MARM1|nr:Fur family transcriptional regulator [Marinomonas mediterranea]ADZ89497.1 ferric uptake regulator, Fur family [Marinomonas mediterranea MMB-1]WCN15746.1 transcriptional repressor [Marinomonas mediterranea MMB-1]
MTEQSNDTTHSSHNHGQCIEQALSTAESLCAEHGQRLTKVRRRALELIWQSHRPLGAYQLLAKLSEEGFNSAPPTVYRALEFLLSAGLIHKVESMNAYLGCSHADKPHKGYFLICDECQNVMEFDYQDIHQSLINKAAEHGFQLRSETIELTGLCQRCQNSQNEGPRT